MSNRIEAEKMRQRMYWHVIEATDSIQKLTRLFNKTKVSIENKQRIINRVQTLAVHEKQQAASLAELLDLYYQVKCFRSTEGGIDIALGQIYEDITQPICECTDKNEMREILRNLEVFSRTGGQFAVEFIFGTIGTVIVMTLINNFGFRSLAEICQESAKFEVSYEFARQAILAKLAKITDVQDVSHLERNLSATLLDDGVYAEMARKVQQLWHFRRPTIRQ